MSEFGAQLPRIEVPPPGPASLALAGRLRSVESRNVTWLGPDFPVFWEEARGANVRDADGNVYLDLTAAFGVSLLGHGAAEVRRALGAQADRLLHGMGDVHPPSIKVELLEALVRMVGDARAGAEAGGRATSGPVTSDPAGRSDGLRAVLASTGSEAVEVALKTAHLATRRPGVVAFRGGYHGLTLGALAATARPYFRAPFQERLRDGVEWLDFPTRAEQVEPALERVAVALREGVGDGVAVGAVIVEPVQARGGVRIPADGFAARLSELAREHGVILIADEIYTGLGRCGAALASARVGLEPHLYCLGKVLGGGFPVSACVGDRDVFDAWPESPGEALHTSTFLGHPLGCAAGLAVLERVADGIPEAAEALGRALQAGLEEALAGVEGVREIRGLGLLLGIELGEGEAVRVATEALRAGILLLPAGDRGEVVELSPPVCLTKPQLSAAVAGVAAAVRRVLSGS